MAAKKKTTKKESGITSTVAKSEDGTIQINFTIPNAIIQIEKDVVLNQLIKDVEIPGFRKGNVPKDKAEKHVPENDIKIEIVNRILPKALQDSINENKIQIAIYPKIELVKTDFDKDWQVRAVTCEMPEINLKDYKTAIKDKLSTKKIWTPDEAKKDKGEKKELSPVEKEQIVINTLLENVECTVPSVLVEAEVGDGLSQLLERLDKLGLTLDGYLESIGKTPTQLREEYEKRSKDSIILNLALNKIAEEESIEVKDSEIDEAMKAASADPNIQQSTPTEERKKVVGGVLKRRKTLDMLTNLA